MKTFFSDFPKTVTTIDNIPHSITDITTAYLFLHNKVQDLFLFQKYIVADGDTPESIAEKIYGNTGYYWSILVINNIVNPFSEWVMWGEPFLNWINETYKNLGGLYGIHHFYNVEDNRICDDYDDIRFRVLLNTSQPLPLNIAPITNLDYEVQENDKKRNIVLISPKHISEFVSTFEKMLRNKLN